MNEKNKQSFEFQKMKIGDSEWKRFTLKLKENHADIEKSIVKGQVPLFGYPPITFSPTTKEIDEN